MRNGALASDPPEVSIGVDELPQEAVDSVNVKPVILLDALPTLMTKPLEETVTVPLASTVMPCVEGMETFDPHEAVHGPTTTTISPVTEALIADCTSVAEQEAALRVVAHDGVAKASAAALTITATRFMCSFPSMQVSWIVEAGTASFEKAFRRKARNLEPIKCFISVPIRKEDMVPPGTGLQKVVGKRA